jgi:hypothetical protein
MKDMDIILDNIDVAQSNGDSTTALMAEKVAKQVQIDAIMAQIKTAVDAIGAVKITLSINTALTNTALISGKITLTIDGNIIQITVLNSDTIYTIATKIVNYINANKFYDFIGTVTATLNIIEILYYTNLEYSDVTVDFSDTDSTGVTITTASSINTGVQAQIIALKNEIAIENNFTSDQIIERNQFIIEKEWSDEAYIDSQDLYDEAWDKFEDIREPQINADIDIVNFLEVVDCQRDWDKLSIGDTVYIKYPRLNVDIEAKIIEISFDYDDYGISLTIANVRDIDSDEEKLIKLLYKSVGTSTTINMDRYKWNEVTNVKSDVNNILNNAWASALNAINGGVNESVTVDRRGITIYDSTDPLRFIRMTHGVIGLTQTGGTSYSVAIDPSGVYAQRLIGQIIAGTNLTITNEDNTFTVNSTGVNITNLAQTFSFDEDGLTLTRDDGLCRILINPVDGIKIQKLVNGNFTNVLYADSEGNLVLASDLSAITIDASQIISGTIDTNRLRLNGMDIADELGNVWTRINEQGQIINKAQTPINGSPTLIDQYGINPDFIKRYPNKIRNSSFEVYNPLTLKPFYWTGDGIVSLDATYDETYSLKLTPGQTHQQARHNYSGLVDAYWWANQDSRYSFKHKGGEVTVSVCRETDNGALGLIPNAGTYIMIGGVATLADGIASYTSLTFQTATDWPDGLETFKCLNPAGTGSMYIKFTAGGTVYIDAVQVEPDFTSKWASFYTDGPDSSLLRPDEHEEVLVADWANPIQFNLVNAYSDPPAVTFGVIGVDGDFTNSNSFYFQGEYVMEAIGGVSLYSKINCYIKGSSIPSPTGAKVVMRAMCKGMTLKPIVP